MKYLPKNPNRTATFILIACALLLTCHALRVLDARAAGKSSEPGRKASQRAQEAVEGVKSYVHGDSRKPVRRLMQLVYEGPSNPELREELAERTADMLRSKATVDAKRILCEALAVAGTPDQAPALVKLLEHGQLSFHARSALARIPGPEVNSRLCDALSDASGRTAAGIISSLGRRGDKRAVDAISARLRSKNPEVAGAAVRALGRIDTDKATRALREARPDLPAELRDEADHALLLRAEKLQDSDKSRSALRLYEELKKPGRPVSVRAAAIEGVLTCSNDGREELLREALEGEEALRNAVLHRLERILSAKTLPDLAQTLTDFPASVQVTVIDIVARRQPKDMQDALSHALHSRHKTVRTAALRALRRSRSPSAVPLLTNHLGRQVARQSLVRLTGKGVNKAIIRALQTTDSHASRRHLIKVLLERRATSAASALLQVAKSGKPRTRLAAFRALGKLATTEDVPQLIRLLKSSKKNLRGPAQQALTQTARRAKNRKKGVRAVLSALPDDKSSASYRSLLPVLGQLGGPKALKVVRQALKSAPEATAEAALDVLADWPTGAPLDDLLRIARTTDRPRDRMMALRGFARVAQRADKRSPTKLTEMFAEAFKSAKTAQETKALLGALSSAPTAEALQLARALLHKRSVHKEATLAVLQLSEQVAEKNRNAAISALQEVLLNTNSASTVKRAISVLQQVSGVQNLASNATASSPDGLEKDGSAGGAPAGIDGDEQTYWDEENNQDLYRYRVTFPESRTISLLTLSGYQQENYAPRDFTILCDGQAVKKISDASYEDNLLVARLEPTECRQLELQITRYYGKSPAIRELNIYRIPDQKP